MPHIPHARAPVCTPWENALSFKNSCFLGVGGGEGGATSFAWCFVDQLLRTILENNLKCVTRTVLLMQSPRHLTLSPGSSLCIIFVAALEVCCSVCLALPTAVSKYVMVVARSVFPSCPSPVYLHWPDEIQQSQTPPS